MKRNMTIPSRPAPPPPQTSTVSRYTPTTNWDDTPFQPHRPSQIPSQHPQQYQNAMLKTKKAPPPRPPPPKVVPELKKPAQPQSVNILSNLFGTVGKKSNSKVITKLPPPPPTNHHHHHRPPSMTTTPFTTPSSTISDFQLITFDSPPGSPTLTQKSNSDCISVDSFSSDSNYSSPHNGSMSQTESGFEDDFSQVSINKDPWDVFSGPKAVTTGKANVGGSSFYASTAIIRAPPTSSSTVEFLDPLCNGKSALTKVQTKIMPTIIKPTIPTKPSSSVIGGSFSKLKASDFPSNTHNYFPPSSVAVVSGFDEVEEYDLPSLPMPTCPPPPPPPDEVIDPVDEVQEKDSWGIALYDFNGQQDDDLCFRANDKVYLLKRLNDEWLYGRNRRGCEGMFPANYIDIKIPLCDDKTTTAISSDISSSKAKTLTKTNECRNIRVLFNFNAEVSDDLSLKENDFVNVLYQITPEWLYGEINGRRGQFPANFIEFIPQNLPEMPSTNA